MGQFLLSPRGSGPAAVGEVTALAAEEARHLKTVLRAEPGRILDLTDGRGYRYTGRLRQGTDRRPEVEILTCFRDDQETRPPLLVLAVAVVKGRRFEWALEKACELGAHRIIPLRTEFTVVRPGEGKHGRWRTILTAALKQSGRCLLPELTDVMSLAEALNTMTDFIGYGASPGAERERGGQDVAGPLSPAVSGPFGELAVCIGPEGGWSGPELDLLAGAGAEPLDLGPHVLRTETAAVASLVVLQERRRRMLAQA